jgi:hypothetical protein
VLTTSLPSATISTFYDVALASSGVTGPPTWTVVSGSLPAGITLNASTGRLSGTPTTTGTSRFSVRVAGTSASDPQALELTVQLGEGVRTFQGTTLTTRSNSTTVNRTCSLRTLRVFLRGTSFDVSVVAPGGTSAECSLTTVQEGSFIPISPSGSFDHTTRGPGTSTGRLQRWVGSITAGGLTLRYEQGLAIPGTLTIDPAQLIFRIDFQGAPM